MMQYHFRRVSTNVKIGPMPVVMAPRSTCPDSCKLKGAGCYAELGHVGMHWAKVNAGTAKNLLSFDQLCHTIRALPRKIRWRYGVAGDLPPVRAELDQLVAANQGREVIAYTHGRDLDAYRAATAAGFHINLSADTLAEVDSLPADMSVVVVLPSDARRPTVTPAGRPVAVCPATYAANVTCSTCNLCSRARKHGTVIGFPAHGPRKRMVDARLSLKV